MVLPKWHELVEMLLFLSVGKVFTLNIAIPSFPFFVVAGLQLTQVQYLTKQILIFPHFVVSKLQRHVIVLE